MRDKTAGLTFASREIIVAIIKKQTILIKQSIYTLDIMNHKALNKTQRKNKR
ncbi:hypothetical protein LX69_02541 [Breznakibacter xylanolyticus]|uniref:Uncharacterized protein n=1 Tax=Breznakibacter xylanolyticus TaxID=990 RepID=A0A2W7N1W1_9BACT|nr:hypothetical protein LX69_02541 [Breznakibacter xylanolyticus]